MSAVFEDTQDQHNPNNGRRVESGLELRTLLKDTANRDPFVLTLESPNGTRLDVGIGSAFGTLHAINRDFVAQMAYLSRYSHEQGDLQFLMADTPSPIARRYGLPMNTVLRVAAHFVDTEQLSSDVRWMLI